MATVKHEKKLNIEMIDYSSNHPKCLELNNDELRIKSLETHTTNKYLNLYISFMGENKPILSALPTEYASTKGINVYRYDWLFGITLPSYANLWWNWQKELRKKCALKVQLILKCDNTDFFINEISTKLLTLQPSKDSSNWWYNNLETIRKNLSSVSKLVGKYTAIGEDLLNVSSELANFIRPDEGKNWYVLRYFDSNTNSLAIEWNINKKVLLNYGSVLKGSILLSFHGENKGRKQMKLLLQPQIGFNREDLLCTISYPFHNDESKCIKLIINPVSTIAKS